MMTSWNVALHGMGTMIEGTIRGYIKYALVMANAMPTAFQI
jgi:hypothetical protein